MIVLILYAFYFTFATACKEHIMKKYLWIGMLGLLFCLSACQKKQKGMEEKRVLIETSMGDITVKLYNDTPRHRDNFIKLAQAGLYDNILFHRVVRGFMIQTGDPSIKPGHAPVTVDTCDYRYTIPAEIVYPLHFHKRGALAAARMGDDVNPEKASSATQFYIVTGKTYSSAKLMELYSLMYQDCVERKVEELSRPHMKELYMMRKKGETEKLQALKDSIQHDAEAQVAANPPMRFTDVQKEAYETIGGAPHLDGEYTVFGEVVEGIEVAEAIERVKTIKERPTQEIVIKKVTVLD